MPTRRELLKGGGGAVLAGLAGSSVGAGLLGAATPSGASESSGAALEHAPAAMPGFRPGGPGPLYWSTYDYENVLNTIIPESVWKTNIDWVAETFRDYGYTMVCTDGWIDNTQKVTKHGYIVSQADDWEHDWAWWANYLKSKGMQLGVYYNPLWVTKSAVTDPSVTVVGRPDVKVADIVNPNDYFDGGGQLQWMREAAEDMQLSLVLPNLFDHGSAERQYGDLIRIDNDAGFGTWFTFSGGRETWQPEWSQWNNPFMGFTGFADISGRGQVILDGDPLIMRTFTRDEERESAINLFTLAGAAIAITDHVDTIANNAHVFQNREVLTLRKKGLVGKPVFNNSHALDDDPTSRDPERWVGQLPDGSWAVALFNRSDVTATKSITFADVLGFSGTAAVRDLWAHQDLGPMTDYQIALGPHASVLLSVVPQGAAHFQAEVGAWAGSARFENTFGGHEGMGYVTDLENVGSSVAIGIAVPKAGTRRLSCRVANSTGSPSALTVRALNPETGHVHGSAVLHVPSTSAWTSWQTVPVTLTMAAGTNLVVLGVDSPDQGGVNLDYVALA